MCFTPQISLIIFVVEIILGLIVLRRRPKNLRLRGVYNLSALILFFLGFYQFSQFMLCTTGNADLWGRFGFLVYNLLPAFGLHFAYSLTNNKNKSIYSVYAFPIFFGLVAIFSKNFIASAECNSVFITITHSWNAWLGGVYGIYYSFFIVIMALVLRSAIKNERNKQKKKIFMVGLMGLLVFIIPTFILVILFPSLNIAFPSILCEFALLFAISIFYMMGLIEKSGFK